MQIRLRWAISPEDLVEKECGICACRFRVQECVVIEATTGSPREDRGTPGVEVGQVCEECFRYLAVRNPSAFPSWDDYNPSWDEYMYSRQIDAPPIYNSEEAVIRAQDEGTYGEAFAASWIR